MIARGFPARWHDAVERPAVLVRRLLSEGTIGKAEKAAGVAILARDAHVVAVLGPLCATHAEGRANLPVLRARIHRGVRDIERGEDFVRRLRSEGLRGSPEALHAAVDARDLQLVLALNVIGALPQAEQVPALQRFIGWLQGGPLVEAGAQARRKARAA